MRDGHACGAYRAADHHALLFDANAQRFIGESLPKNALADIVFVEARQIGEIVHEPQLRNRRRLWHDDLGMRDATFVFEVLEYLLGSPAVGDVLIDAAVLVVIDDHRRRHIGDHIETGSESASDSPEFFEPSFYCFVRIGHEHSMFPSLLTSLSGPGPHSPGLLTSPIFPDLSPGLSAPPSP